MQICAKHPERNGARDKRGLCRGCACDAAKKWRTENPERAKEIARKKDSKRKEAISEYHKKWCAENKERKAAMDKEYREKHVERLKELAHARYLLKLDDHKEKGRKWYLANKDKVYAKAAAWRTANSTHHRECANAWKRAHPETVYAETSRRRAAKLNAAVLWADKKKIRETYAEAQRLIRETGESWHVDHIIPLRSKIVCGLHNEFNLQVIPGVENLRKHNRLLQD